MRCTFKVVEAELVALLVRAARGGRARFPDTAIPVVGAVDCLLT